MRRTAFGVATALALVAVVGCKDKDEKKEDSANGGVGAAAPMTPAPSTAAVDSAAAAAKADSTRVADSIKAAAAKKP